MISATNIHTNYTPTANIGLQLHSVKTNIVRYFMIIIIITIIQAFCNTSTFSNDTESEKFAYNITRLP